MSRQKSILTQLRKASRERSNIGEIIVRAQQWDNYDDRTIAIMRCAEIERALERLIYAKMVDLNTSEGAELFEGMGPLSSFSARIKIAYALGGLAKEARNDLNVIRAVRNAFAHSERSLSFETAKVADTVSLIGILNRTPEGQHLLGTAPEPLTTRWLFDNSCRFYQRHINQSVMAFSIQDQSGAPPVY